MKSSDESLLSTVPPIRRARGYRLYTGDGRRYLDCWQDDGGAVLGHRAGSYRQAFLNKAARGLLLPIPGPEHGKLEKAVRALWRSWTSDLAHLDRRVHLFRNRERMKMALGDAFGAVPRFDPLAEPEAPADFRLVVARPFMPVYAGMNDWIEPVLPLARAIAPAVLLGPVGTAVDSATTSRLEGDYVPAGMLAALSRSVYDLLRVQRAGVHPGAHFAGELAETGVWTAHGPWLVPAIGGAEPRYRRLFELHLAEGVLINPEPGGTSIVPAESSAGERAWMRTAALRAREEGLVQ
ncbi:MAG: hypothetical protein ACOCZ9_00720 [Spirochaetota bacterium]